MNLTEPQNNSLDNIYAEIGRQVVAARLHALNFAAKAGGAKKQKACKKGYSCGYSCINKNKECGNPLDGQGKTFAEYLNKVGSNSGDNSQKPTPKPDPKPDPEPPTLDLDDELGDFEDFEPLDLEPIDLDSGVLDLELVPEPQVVYDSGDLPTPKKPIPPEPTGSHDIIDKDWSTAAEQAQKYADVLGVTPQRFNTMKQSVYLFASDAYTDIRDAEAGRAAAGKELKATIGAINEYIEKAPKYDGNVYRGLNFDDQDQRQKFINDLIKNQGLKQDAMSSWSSSAKIADDFVAGGAEKDYSPENGVMIVTRNRSGASIKQLSAYSREEEVLTPKGTTYALKRIVTGPNGELIVEVEDYGKQ